ncbi:hypothetical protein NOL38_08575 [Streptococcus suis]|uniref:hypothetical protein n=1 Tax=Streptococcus suis TaxID=1307 RepID=UPI0024129A0E|nr:hypothetical protein [Streptococcus suis]MDG4506305.1 hypothetical protein [Streptococcus suis]
MEKQSRLIATINGVYVLAKASTYFWWGLVRRGFVYGCYGALATCLALYESSQPYYVSLKEVDYLSKESKVSEMLISSFMTFAFLLSLVSWFGLLQNYSDQLLLGFLVGSMFWLVLMVWLPYYQRVAGPHFKKSLAMSLHLISRNLNDVAVQGTILTLLFYLALTKHLLVWFFMPGIYCLVLTKISQLRKEKKNDTGS